MKNTKQEKIAELMFSVLLATKQTTWLMVQIAGNFSGHMNGQKQIRITWQLWSKHFAYEMGITDISAHTLVEPKHPLTSNWHVEKVALKTSKTQSV